MFEELFAARKPCAAKLLRYGFCSEGEKYCYCCEVMNGSFFLQVTLAGGMVDTALTDKSTGEEYILYKTPAQGAFVGAVRQAIAQVLQDVADSCFEWDLYRQPQTLRLLGHAAAEWGDAPDFPFGIAERTGILRHPVSGKWYAAILNIPKTKLGLASEQVVEVVNLHASAPQVQQLLGRPHFYPGWHMNKKYWYTVILDGSVADEELFQLLEVSRGSVR